jgi:hypothetical protein
MKPRLRPRSNSSRRATSQMLRARLIGRPPRAPLRAGPGVPQQVPRPPP